MECTDDESEQGVCLCPAISSRVVVWCERVVEEDDQESKPGILVRSVCPSDMQHRAVRRLAGQARSDEGAGGGGRDPRRTRVRGSAEPN